MIQFKNKQNKLCHLVFNLDTDIKGEISWIGEDSEYLQLGIWKYKADKYLQKHVHIRNERTITRTQEIVIVLKGIVVADLYDLDKNLLDTVNLYKNDVLISILGGHGFTILSDDTLALEVKNGPFVSVEADKIKF